MNLAYAYQNAHDYPNAVSEYQNALLLSSDRQGPEYRLYRQLAAMNIGNIYINDHQPDAALHIMAPIWNDDPGYPGLALNIGMIFARQGRLDLAIATFEEGIKYIREYPSFPQPWLLYLDDALAYNALHQCDKFRTYFKAAQQLAYPEPIADVACN